MQKLLYTNEFLKNIQPIIEKNNFEMLQKIKEMLEKISSENTEKEKLANIKTYSNEDIYQEIVEEKRTKYSLFWTEKEEQKLIIALVKNLTSNK